MDFFLQEVSCHFYVMFPHRTKIFKNYFRNIPCKYCKIAKIFRNLLLVLLKYCTNLAVSAQNMTYAIFSKYCQNIKNVFLKYFISKIKFTRLDIDY